MGLRGRLLLAFLVPTLLLLSLGGFGLYRASRNVLEEELGRSLAGIAASVSSQLKGERVLSIEAGDAEGEGSRTWRSLTAQLTEVKQRTTEVYGTAPALKSEEIPIDITPAWGANGQVCIRQTAPLPLTLSGLSLDVTLGG